MTFEKFKKSNIDLSNLGFETRSERSNYFCTPIGAKAIGWAGVDGIHFCTISDFGDMVFSISPMNTPGDYVHPLAESFSDFLRLLLACGDTAAIEQAHWWTQERFDAFLAENQPTEEQISVLNQLKETFDLSPMEEPFAYIKRVQSAFDYRKLRFKKDYNEWASSEPLVPTAPEWKVYYNGSLFGHHGRERAGQEISIDKQFVWGEEIWHIPAVYACSSGLVVDFCVEVEPKRIKTFLDKWANTEPLTNEQQEKIDFENPLNVEFFSNIVLNGKPLYSEGRSGTYWMPDLDLENNLEAKWVLEHYGLDSNKGWAIHRAQFKWATKRKPEIKTMKLTLKPRPVSISATHFITPEIGKNIAIVHPLTGIEYTLTVDDITQDKLDTSHFRDDAMEHPSHYTRMAYRLSPELPDAAFQIHDCAESDPLRPKNVTMLMPQSIPCALIGIIGGADGPTTLVFGGESKMGKLRMACSSLHFEPVEKVEWRFVFKEIMRDEISIDVI